MIKPFYVPSYLLQMASLTLGILLFLKQTNTCVLQVSQPKEMLSRDWTSRSKPLIRFSHLICGEQRREYYKNLSSVLSSSTRSANSTDLLTFAFLCATKSANLLYQVDFFCFFAVRISRSGGWRVNRVKLAPVSRSWVGWAKNSSGNWAWRSQISHRSWSWSKQGWRSRSCHLFHSFLLGLFFRFSLIHTLDRIGQTKGGIPIKRKGKKV